MIMKKLISFVVIFSVGLFLAETFYPVMAKNRVQRTELESIIAHNGSSEWKIYGEVNALHFRKFDWLYCIGDATKYENISKKFYELEDEGGYLLKPYIVSILIYYRYYDGEKQYRMYYEGNRNRRYVNFSLNPHTTIEYVIDNNNRPNMREKDVSNYTHFLEVDGELYFIKMK